MACSVCGSENAAQLKHLPIPEGWIELSDFTYYCTPCAKNEAAKLNEIFKKSKEAINNG